MKITDEKNFLTKKAELQKMLEQGDFIAAMQIAKAILKIVPNDYMTLFYLSRAYLRMNEQEKAHKVIRKFLQICADSYEWEPLYYLAKLQFQSRQTAGDITTEKKIMQRLLLDDAQKKLLYQLLRDNYILLGEAKKSVMYALKATEKSKEYEQYSKMLFIMHYLPEISQKIIFNKSQKISSYFRQIKQYSHAERISVSKIRIGYISPNFNKHAVALFIYHLIANYDREKFEVYCYAKGVEDPITEQLKQYPDKWVNVSNMSDVEIAQTIYDDNVNILFELAGHTDNNALAVLARKPAPIQICGIGYFNTTGLNSVDYFLTDKYCDPIGKNDEYFTEKLLRLKYSQLCYTPLNPAFQIKEAPCVKNQYITFGSMNFLSKINLPVIKTWQKILDKVPNSRLLIKDKVVGNEYAVEYIKKIWQKNGIDLTRIDFEDASEDYMQMYYKIDIALDTFPYPGGATTCDALYMGVPVVTLAGDRHGSRFGYSILKNIMNEEDCIAVTINEYVDKSVILAGDYNKINDYHHELRDKMLNSPVMNSDIYMKDLQNAYKIIWQEYVKGANSI